MGRLNQSPWPLDTLLCLSTSARAGFPLFLAFSRANGLRTPKRKAHSRNLASSVIYPGQAGLFGTFAYTICFAVWMTFAIVNRNLRACSASPHTGIASPGAND